MSGDGADRLANVSAALLLGGASSRMGRDKAQMELGGLPFATRIARLLAALFEEVWLIGGSPPADAPGTPVPDVPGPRCALRGVATALEASREPRVVVVATDLPLLTPDLLLGLVAAPEADVVLPDGVEGVQPLCAVYRRETALPAARAQLAGPDLALRALLARLDTLRLDAATLASLDPQGHALANVNTPEDLLRAAEVLRAREAESRASS